MYLKSVLTKELGSRLFLFFYYGHPYISLTQNCFPGLPLERLGMVHISIISGIKHFSFPPGPLIVLQVVVYFTRFYSTSECSGQAISFPNGACNGLFGRLARELRARYFLMFWFHPKEVTLPEHGPPLKVWVPSPWDSCNQINRSRVYFTTHMYAFSSHLIQAGN